MFKTTKNNKTLSRLFALGFVLITSLTVVGCGGGGGGGSDTGTGSSAPAKASPAVTVISGKA